MTTLLICFALYSQIPQEGPDPEFVERCWQKVKAVTSLVISHDGGLTNFASAYEKNRLKVTVDDNGKLNIKAGSRVHAIFAPNGQMRMISTLVTIGEHSPPAKEFWQGISEETAVEIAKDIYSLLDDRVTLNIHRVEDMGWKWQISAFPQTEPWPLGEGHECIFDIAKHRGQLLVAYLNYAPDLSAAQGGVMEERALKTSALDAYTRWEPFEHAEIRGSKIALGIPYFGAPMEITDEHVALAKAKKVIPLYQLMVANADSTDPKTGKFSEWQVVYVDARNGKAVAIWPNALLGSDSTNLKKSLPDLQAETTMVYGGEILAKLVLGTKKSKTKPADSGCKLLLVQGSHVWVARADPNRRNLTACGQVFPLGKSEQTALKRISRSPDKRFGKASETKPNKN